MRGKIGTMLAAVAAAAGAVGAAKWAKGRKDQEAPDQGVSSPPADSSHQASAAAETARATAAPSADATGETTPAATSDSGADDLTAIKGLGKVKAARLAEAGIISYAQVAAWTDDDIAEIGLKVNTSPGQIKREDWVGQARALAER